MVHPSFMLGSHSCSEQAGRKVGYGRLSKTSPARLANPCLGPKNAKECEGSWMDGEMQQAFRNGTLTIKANPDGLSTVCSFPMTRF